MNVRIDIVQRLFNLTDQRHRDFWLVMLILFAGVLFLIISLLMWGTSIFHELAGYFFFVGLMLLTVGAIGIIGIMPCKKNGVSSQPSN